MTQPSSAERNDAIAVPPHLSDLDAMLVADLVDANRILFRQGVVDAFGHISVRHPVRAGNFLLARNMAPALVTATDLLEFGPNSEPVQPDAQRVYLERFLHGEIYRARPDVMAVVHSHSPAVIPFGLVPGRTLRPVCHMASFLGRAVPVFEIRRCAGEDSDMLIRSRELGAALAVDLSHETAVLMRGHGSTVVGADIRQAVFRAIYTEVNARLQADALRLGEPICLTEAEAAASARTNAGQVARPWELWRRAAWA